MPYATAIMLAGTAIYSGIEANDRKQKAKKGIERLKKMQPKYRTAQDIQFEAENAIRSGYSPSERANFQQSMTRRANQARRTATDRNPNLSGAINAGINYGSIQGELGFAAQDAALRRQRVSEYVGRITGQSNAQTGADITSKMQQEIAYGNAKNQANADIYNSLMQLGYAGASAAKTANAQKNPQAPDGGTPTFNEMNSGPNGYPNPGQYNSINADPLGAQPPSLTAPPNQPNFGSQYYGVQRPNSPYTQSPYKRRPPNIYADPYAPVQDFYSYY
jgi:hypothetical protein